MQESGSREVAIVTGGAGFLGSHICDRLLAKGYEVWAVDNLLTGKRANVPKGAQLWVRDVSFPEEMEDIRQALGGVRVRYVFNFACPASPPKYQADPVHTMMTSVVGTRETLALATFKGATFVQASTSEVYGDPLEHPQRESYRGCVNTTGPRACYDEGKRAAEALCYDYARMFQTDVRVVRIFNTYGPRMDPNDGRVVTNFINQALEGTDITVYGDGKQTRSFCYVDDLVDGIMALAEKQAAPKTPVNIGNPAEFTMTDLAAAVLRLTDSSSEISFQPLPVDDPKQRCPDISLARELLGWEPRVSLEDGLRRTVEYFRKS